MDQTKSPESRLRRWIPYLVVAPLAGALYAGFCWWFAVEAWGFRGQPKPAWFDAAFALTVPAMFANWVSPPGGESIVVFLMGGGFGALIVRMVRWLMRAQRS